MKASVLATCSLLALGVLGPASATQITNNEFTRIQQWEADARDARSRGVFDDCAAEDPQAAIRACTRQLRTQGNRSRFASGLEQMTGYPRDDARDAARTHFSNAVRYVLRGNAYSSQNDTRRALRDYDSAVRSARDAGAAYAHEVYWVHERRAEAYYFAGEYEDAIESYEAAIEINSGSANVLHFRTLELAASYEEMFRDEPQALAYAHLLNMMVPENPEYVAALAIAYAANGDFARAMEEQRRAIAVSADGDQRTRDAYQRRLNLFSDGKYVLLAPRLRIMDLQTIRVLDADAPGVLDLEAPEPE